MPPRNPNLKTKFTEGERRGQQQRVADQTSQRILNEIVQREVRTLMAMPVPGPGEVPEEKRWIQETPPTMVSSTTKRRSTFIPLALGVLAFAATLLIVKLLVGS